MAFSSPLLLCVLSPLPMICVLLSRKSSLDDRFTAGLGGCLALWCDYETVARVVVEAATPSDPGFNLLNLPVVVWFEGVVSGFNLVAFLGILVGHILCLGIIVWSRFAPAVGQRVSATAAAGGFLLILSPFPFAPPPFSLSLSICFWHWERVWLSGKAPLERSSARESASFSGLMASLWLRSAFGFDPNAVEGWFIPLLSLWWWSCPALEVEIVTLLGSWRFWCIVFEVEKAPEVYSDSEVPREPGYAGGDGNSALF
ncbi:hypothetical protein DY000_02017116 [Brassica cretica]|uniref:Transmembrane protein n=1 Tax=Brassica cretica TaxID=69181 RepID=A0ABQ7CTG2_BRACR|nr:hypothetical protein DY000_02017116 [Brassica cretica]